MSNAQCQPDKQKLKRKTGVRDELIRSGVVSPVPHHVDVGWIDSDEEAGGCVCAATTRGWPQEHCAHDDFGDTTYIGPERFTGREPRRNDVIEEIWICEMSDSGKEQEHADYKSEKIKFLGCSGGIHWFRSVVKSKRSVGTE